MLQCFLRGTPVHACAAAVFPPSLEFETQANLTSCYIMPTLVLLTISFLSLHLQISPFPLISTPTKLLSASLVAF